MRCKGLDSDVQCKRAEDKQFLNVLRQLERTEILTFQALQELDGSVLSHVGV